MIATFAYLLVCIYVASFLILSAGTARAMGRSVWLFRIGDPAQQWTGLAFRLAFTGALLWPAYRLWQNGENALHPIAHSFQTDASPVIGAVLIVLGAALALLSQHHMGAAWRIGAAEGEQGQLVDTGPFAWSRNPVFVGQGTVFLGLLLIFPDLVQLSITTLALLAIRQQVRLEERVLRATFGSVYQDYADRVPRWIGRINSKAPGQV